MPKATISLNVTIGGVSVSKTWEREADHPNPYEVTLPVADAGRLTTRTDDNTGVVTMSDAGHGIITGNKVDVYWTGGMRYGMDATVAGTAVTLDGGAGANLPADETDVVCCVQFSIATSIDGDVADVFVASLEYADSAAVAMGHIDLQKSGSVTVAEFNLEPNKALFVDVASDLANPLTGDPIILCLASHGDTVNSATLKICTLEDRTP